MWMWLIIIIELLPIPLGIWMLFLPEKNRSFKICSIFLIVLGPIAASITAYLSFAKNPFSQNVGVLTPKYKTSYTQKDLSISIHGEISKQTFTIQMKDNVIVQPFGRNVAFSLERTKKGLFISMVMRSIDGKIVAKMIRNTWQLNPNNYFRKNFDAHALEVIDEFDIPVLQIEYLDAITLRIGGIFFAESANTSDIYPDFPSVPNNVGEIALVRPVYNGVIILGKRTMFIYPQPRDPSETEKIRAEAKSFIEPWFDYSNPEKIGIRKAVESITISKKDRKKYSDMSRDKLKDTVTIFVHDLREFTGKSNKEFSNAFETVQSNEALEKIWVEWSKRSLMEYNRRFKIETIILRDELLSRLPKNFVHEFSYTFYEDLASLSDFNKVADDLERLANNL